MWCMSESDASSCIVDLTIDHFNVLKFLLTSLFLGSSLGFFLPALEKYRRAIELRRRCKVCIGSATSGWARIFGITAPPTALALGLTITLLVLIAECSLELSSDSIVLPKDHNVTLTMAQVTNWSSEKWHNETTIILNGLGSCTEYNKTGEYLRAWPSVVLNRTTHKELFCATNVTAHASNFTKIHAKDDSTITHLHHFIDEVHRIQQVYNGTMEKDEQKTVPYMVKVQIDVSGKLHRGVAMPYGTVEGTVFVHPPNGSRGDMLECYVHRHMEDGIVFARDNMGCVGLDADGTHMIYYKNEYLTGPENEAKLRPFARSPWFSAQARRAVMHRIFEVQPETLQDWLYAALIVRMISDGEFQIRSEERREFTVWAPDTKTRPKVNLWIVGLVVFLSIFLFVLAVGFQCASYRMLPYLEIVGEDNIVRVWSREKSGIGSQTGASWLKLDIIDDEQRVTAHVDEPKSHNLNITIPMCGLSNIV